MPGGSSLKIDQWSRAGHHVLALSGDLDLASATELDAAVAELCGSGARELEIDLRDLDFIDSSGIRSILRAREACAEGDVEFFLVPARKQPRTVFEIAGLLDVLPWRSPG